MSARTGPKSPHGKPRVMQGTLRQKAWRAMQIKGKFTLSDLVRNAVSEEDKAKDPRNNIGRYVAGLTHAGILVEMRRRAVPTSPTSNGEKRWTLVRDLGRKAPVMRKGGNSVFDPNSGQMIPVIREEAGDDQ
ncbi:hypothetical protein [Propionivibrio dicarboxylicus]|uniref:Uncharacterized protein n=1 Tax=Propionivibrio dicarboxylicus TaxID=83767 RepID=A0A1G8L976_9RHOO|nr:hypothetical protein [Propionivibrio dicarboxylicus]SDI52229.1 hypothetical protein SAMN05660652_03577 [Propionivibrio dicarboxylicus]